ncbi:unnamed protein product, partial [Symbiodinium pilosum]
VIVLLVLMVHWMGISSHADIQFVEYFAGVGRLAQVAEGGTIVLENPMNSLIALHDRYVWMVKLLRMYTYSYAGHFVRLLPDFFEDEPAERLPE